MGTNYYVKKKLTDAQRTDIQSIFDSFLDGDFRSRDGLRVSVHTDFS